MLTKNYNRLLAYLFARDLKIKAKNYSGTDISFFRNAQNQGIALGWGAEDGSVYAASMANLKTSLSNYGGVILGDGDTPPTSDDYKLAGNIVTGFNYSKTLTQVVSETAVTAKAVYTITNANSTEITIKEIGLIGNADNSASSSKIFLLDRTVLDTPVTIPAGGIGQVEYTITFNLPTST